MLRTVRRGTLLSFTSPHIRAASTVPRKDVDHIAVKNEPILQYKPKSQERSDLQAALDKYKSQCIDIPIIVGNEEIRKGDISYQRMPFDHAKSVARLYHASPEVVNHAIRVSQEARVAWEATPLNERIKVYLKAADLISKTYRMDLNAATMLGQGKTVIQAEIDSAVELADFLRFNAFFAKELTQYQPISENPQVTVNALRLRGLEGFIASVSPFNFTAIGGNLATAPALMGNVVLWKPANTSVLSNYLIFRVMQEAGLPPGVINFIPSKGPVFGGGIVASPSLAAVNFTGSVPTFQRLWQQIGQNLAIYDNFPRMVGECGGKNFHFVHPTADVETVVATTVRAAFEYSGQKCSACSRLYVPESLWSKVKEGLLEIHKQLKIGSPLEFDTFMSAVIDEPSFDNIEDYIKYAQISNDLTIIAGGKCDKSIGYFIEPTIVETVNPKDKLMKEEIFGPVLTTYVYDDRLLHQTLELAGSTTPFALTGAIFASDREFIEYASNKLKMACGNFYINDKCTGAVVGQQPFGGGRLSGTNDKAGGPHYLLRFASPQAIKETFVPLHDWKYPYMQN